MKLFRLTPVLGPPAAHALRIAANQQWIEHTPIDYAAKNIYNKAGNGDTATVVFGGVPNLGSDPSVDLAANAETQGLKFLASSVRSMRLIGIIVEVTYRLVADRSRGISDLADLRGKRIGTIPGTSAEVFIRRLLETEAGLSWERGDYTTVAGNACMREPCGSNTLPAMLRDGRVDAFGIWETAVELGVRALGDDRAITFKNASIYREVYSLYSTEAKLRDTRTRARIVEFVRALNQTYDLFRAEGDDVYAAVSQNIGVDVPVLRSVWADHVWGPGSLGETLIDYLEVEDQYLAKVDNRAPFSRADLERFVDNSVYEEAMQG
ncbi:hypothetical protein C7999DRAFT_39945 [Corynascus novoguineensis]|uniref:SsuA/THI5-like domain-containing protein n=1 Tax=Corynascus novoguineensis TaxID=1126955 RepID=A0AAN7CX99_9PEZI|nr:hypothetical protein C7999DRAFT_39945 [Corynascus novoguineensis]